MGMYCIWIQYWVNWEFLQSDGDARRLLSYKAFKALLWLSTFEIISLSYDIVWYSLMLLQSISGVSFRFGRPLFLVK